MGTEIIWRRIVDAASDPAVIESDERRRALLSEAMTLGSTITPDSVGCSITEQTPSGFCTPVASSAVALALDSAQYAAGDGPCVAACRDGQVHSITVMTDERAYPAFTEAAVRHDVRSSLSLPLAGTDAASALNLYARSPSAFESAHANAVAMLLARCTAAILTADPLPPDRMRDPRHGERVALLSRATSVLIDRLGFSSEEAFAELVRRSDREQRSVFAVARALVGQQPGTAPSQ